MISISEAKELAEKYVNNEGEIHPGIRHGVGEFKEYSECYYFDFKLIFDTPQDPGTAFGGAPGFTVDKVTGEIQVIAFWKLAQLK